MQNENNIHPIFGRLLQREDKESLLKQKSICIWMTGLSGSGKSTIAEGLEKKLHQNGILSMVLDGDNIRSGINKNLSFSEEDRTENIRRIAEINKLFLNCGIITINCFVSPTLDIREQAKDIIGDADFFEIYINASFDECAKRDVKGLYAKALKGEIKNFTGLDAPFEAPKNPSLEIKTAELSIEESIDKIYNHFINKIKQ
ncbi:MAG: adenylyl-sulfate kinase [Chitinophagales bacterium]|jgi:adenylylsulfate kinase